MSNVVTITGGGGFIGAHLVRRMVREGWEVRVIDSMTRGSASRFSDVAQHVDLHTLDIRDEDRVAQAIVGSEVVFHLAAVNGTENFYKHPELVLDVGLRGALSVVNACRRSGVLDLVVASSAEVYQTPSIVPTPEEIPLMLPDSLNPRYSYGGSKIVSELIAFNYAREHFRKLQVFRPHNVYGPDMGWKHVIPQFIVRALELARTANCGIQFPIQGSGTETRAFCYVDDIVDGLMIMYKSGSHREIFHIGNDEEVSIHELAQAVGESLDLDLHITPSVAPEGGTPRRCPDISKLKKLGYSPAYDLAAGLRPTVDWYVANAGADVTNSLM